MKIHPVANLFPMLPEEELARLADSIKRNGLQHKLTRQDGVLLDGRNRWAACKLAGVDPQFIEYKGDSPVTFIISTNLERRHLDVGQRAALGVELEPHYAREAKERQKAAGGDKKSVVAKKPQAKSGKRKRRPPARDQAAKAVKVGGRYVSDMKKIKEEAPDLFDEVKSGRMTVAKAKKELKARKAAATRKKAVAKIEIHDQIWVGDFRVKGREIPDESVDLIFTDPPYDRKSAGLYKDLAEFAKCKLVEGGSLIAYCGHYLLPELLPAMSDHLRFWWLIACKHSGPLARMREYGIKVGWKPMLWFVKGTRGDKETWIDDLVAMDGGREKEFHDWQQAESEAAYFIETLCPKDGCVVDPFLGGGTTAAAAKALKRRWIGIEIDETNARMSSKRLGL